MERMINYFGYYRKLSEEAQHFLRINGKLKQYQSNSYYKLYNERVEKWSFIIDGLVARISYHNQREIIERFYTSHYYFSGTNHAFSKNADPIALKFLRESTIYEISHKNFKEGVNLFPELNDMYQILKQHDIRYTQQLISILKSPSLHRIHLLASHQPQLYNSLTIKEKMAYLDISNYKYYYRALTYHLYY